MMNHQRFRAAPRGPGRDLTAPASLNLAGTPAGVRHSRTIRCDFDPHRAPSP